MSYAIKKNIKNPIGSHPIIVAKCVEKIIYTSRDIFIKTDQI